VFSKVFLSRREETAEVVCTSLRTRCFAHLLIFEQTKGTSEKILQGLRSLRKLVTSRIRNGNEESEIERLEKIHNLTYVFEVEQLCRIASWTQLEAVIQVNVSVYYVSHGSDMFCSRRPPLRLPQSTLMPLRLWLI